MKNSLQRNGGPFRIVICSLLTLIQARTKRNIQNKTTQLLDENDLLNKLTLLMFEGDSKSQQVIDILVSDEIKLPDNKSKTYNKRTNSIFNIAPKFRVASSWEAKLTRYDQWNAEKTKSTHMIKFPQTVLKESICLLQDSDFIVFYFTLELLKCIMHNYDDSTFQILIQLIKISNEKYKSQSKYLPDAYIQYVNQLIK